MKKTRFTKEQIIGVLKLAEAGQTVAEICRGQGVLLLGAVGNFRPAVATSASLAPGRDAWLRMRMEVAWIMCKAGESFWSYLA